MNLESTKPSQYHDPLSSRVIKLLAYMKADRSDKPSIATGFLLSKGDKLFLVSNYHVFTGVTPKARFTGGNPRVPAVIEVWNFGVPLADIHPASGYWVHPEFRSIQCDIAVYDLAQSKLPEKGEPHLGSGRIYNKRVQGLSPSLALDAAYPMEGGAEPHIFVQDAFLPIAKDATVFGFPGGVEFDHGSVGVNTKIASSFYGELPYFLVSGTPYKGCSGGPVVARSFSGYLALQKVRHEAYRADWQQSYQVIHAMPETAVVDQLIGIYSGRMRHPNSIAEGELEAGYLGQVWKWELILRTLADGILDSCA